MIPKFVILAKNEKTGNPALMGFANSIASAEEMKERAEKDGWLSVTVTEQSVYSSEV